MRATSPLDLRTKSTASFWEAFSDGLKYSRGGSVGFGIGIVGDVRPRRTETRGVEGRRSVGAEGGQVVCSS